MSDVISSEGMKRNDSDPTDLVAVLRKAFADSGLSLSALNRAAGTQYASTHRFFRGTRGDASVLTVAKWAKALGLELKPAKRSPSVATVEKNRPALKRAARK